MNSVGVEIGDYVDDKARVLSYDELKLLFGRVVADDLEGINVYFINADDLPAGDRANFDSFYVIAKGIVLVYHGDAPEPYSEARFKLSTQKARAGVRRAVRRERTMNAIAVPQTVLVNNYAVLGMDNRDRAADLLASLAEKARTIVRTAWAAPGEFEIKSYMQDPLDMIVNNPSFFPFYLKEMPPRGINRAKLLKDGYIVILIRRVDAIEEFVPVEVALLLLLRELAHKVIGERAIDANVPKFYELLGLFVRTAARLGMIPAAWEAASKAVMKKYLKSLVNDFEFETVLPAELLPAGAIPPEASAPRSAHVPAPDRESGRLAVRRDFQAPAPFALWHVFREHSAAVAKALNAPGWVDLHDVRALWESLGSPEAFKGWLKKSGATGERCDAMAGSMAQWLDETSAAELPLRCVHSGWLVDMPGIRVETATEAFLVYTLQVNNVAAFYDACVRLLRDEPMTCGALEKWLSARLGSMLEPGDGARRLVEFVNRATVVEPDVVLRCRTDSKLPRVTVPSGPMRLPPPRGDIGPTVVRVGFRAKAYHSMVRVFKDDADKVKQALNRTGWTDLHDVRAKWMELGGTKEAFARWLSQHARIGRGAADSYASHFARWVTKADGETRVRGVHSGWIRDIPGMPADKLEESLQRRLGVETVHEFCAKWTPLNASDLRKAVGLLQSQQAMAVEFMRMVKFVPENAVLIPPSDEDEINAAAEAEARAKAEAAKNAAELAELRAQSRITRRFGAAEEIAPAPPANRSEIKLAPATMYMARAIEQIPHLSRELWSKVDRDAREIDAPAVWTMRAVYAALARQRRVPDDGKASFAVWYSDQAVEAGIDENEIVAQLGGIESWWNALPKLDEDKDIDFQKKSDAVSALKRNPDRHSGWLIDIPGFDPKRGEEYYRGIFGQTAHAFVTHYRNAVKGMGAEAMDAFMREYLSGERENATAATEFAKTVKLIEN